MKVFWALWGDLGASFRHPWAPFGYPWGPCWCLVGTLGCGPGPLTPLLWKRLQKGTRNGGQRTHIFNDFCSCRRKWKTAFGLRLCSRNRGGASRFHSLSHHWRPLFFQRFFDVLWGPKKANAAGVGVRGGTPFICLQEQSTCYLYLEPCLGLLLAAWWVVPRPAAGSTSPSASTRPREVGV